MTKIERLALARDRTTKMVAMLNSSAMLSASNSMILFSDHLSKQIPESFAANAFNEFQIGMQNIEIARLSAFWDKYGQDRVSIPTVVKIIEDQGVIEVSAKETREHWLSRSSASLWPANNPCTDGQITELITSLATQQEQTALDAGSRAICRSKSAMASDAIEALTNYRNNFVAHNLDLKDKSNVRALKYGDTREILELTVQIISDLHLSLNGSSFDWAEMQTFAKQAADDLWQNCTFQVNGPGSAEDPG